MRQHVSILNSACKQAVAASVIRRNTCASVVLPRPERKEARALTEEEQGRILAALHGLPAYLPTLVALASGLRLGEVLGLRWRDIDFDACSLTVSQTIISVGGHPQIKPAPKTHHSRRSLVVHPDVIQELRDHREAQKKQARGIGKTWPKTNLVFRSADGGLMRPDYVGLAWRRARDRLGIGDRFRDLRHTHASMLIKDGAQLKMVQARLGHSSAGTTQQIYLHLMPGMEAAIVADMPIPKPPAKEER